MKNTLKLAALLTVLLITVSTFAQKVSQGIMTRAQNRIDNLCQTVKLDDAAKQKAVDLTCRLLLTSSDLQKQKKENKISEGECNVALKKSVDEYWKEILVLIPKDQLEAFREWKQKPMEERNTAPSK